MFMHVLVSDSGMASGKVRGAPWHTTTTIT